LTSFCGIELRSPIVNASGTFDALAAHRAFGDELFERFPLAAFVSKTVTLKPREGNPPPRLWETASGLINSIGLPNKGLEGYLAHDLPFLARLPVPLIVNVMGFTRDEVAQLVEACAARDEVAALELNVSCPNVESGLIMGADPGETAALVERLRPLTRKPLIEPTTRPRTTISSAMTLPITCDLSPSSSEPQWISPWISPSTWISPLELTLPMMVRSSPMMDGTILLALGPGLLAA